MGAAGLESDRAEEGPAVVVGPTKGASVMFKFSLKAVLTAVCAGALFCSGSRVVAQDELSDMLDQVTLVDGRQFSGNIVEETDEAITMEVIKMGMRTKQTWSRKDILEVLHDAVPNTEVKKTQAQAEVKAASGKVLYDPSDTRHTVYKVPIRGQVGLDSHTRIIRMIWDEAIAAHAKTIILEFDCSQPLGQADLEEYREFFEGLKREARSKEIRVVVWVKNAQGVALAYALMFPEIYFQPDGEMGGGWVINEQLSASFQDPSVRAKMVSAWTAICRGMAEEGDHDAMLCEAMIRPEFILSMDYEGDQPRFRNDTQGKVVLDDKSGEEPENVLELTADQANKFGISGGTYRTVDDLMFNLGFREYRYVEGNAEEFATKWAEGWKKAMDEYGYIRADMALIDTYDEPIEKKIAKKISKLRDVQALIKKWPPLELYIIPEQIYFEIDTFKKELRNINNGNNSNNNSGGNPDNSGGGGK